MGYMPEFIPTDRPETPILDLSHKLTPTTIANLNQSCTNLDYSAKVLILPANYTSPDLHSLALDVSRAWRTNTGNTMLMVVDLKGHKVRIIGSPQLNKGGITTDYITNELIPKEFVPYMKAGDLSSAVRLSLQAANSKLTGKRQALETASTPPTASTVQSGKPMTEARTAAAQPAPIPGAHNTVPLLPTPALLAAILTVLVLGFVFVRKKQKSDNIKNFAALQKSIDKLHEKANQLGLGSDYLDSQNNAKLARDISDFFAKLLTLEKAYEETQKLLSSPSECGETTAAIARCNRYIATLDQAVNGLLAEVNQLTGYVPTYEPNATIPAATPLQDETNVGVIPQPVALEERPNKRSNIVSFPSGHSYRAPSWVVTPENAYLEAGGLAAIALFLDRMRQRQAMDSMPVTAYHPYSQGSTYSSDYRSSSWRDRYDAYNNRYDDGPSIWDTSDTSNSGWSWDSGSSDSSSDSGSSSDGGGSW